MSRQSEANNAQVAARESLRALLPYRSTVYYTLLSHSRSGATSRVQFLVAINGPRQAQIGNITRLVAEFAGYLNAYDPASATMRIPSTGVESIIQNLGRTLHGDWSKGNVRKGHAEHMWFDLKDIQELGAPIFMPPHRLQPARMASSTDWIVGPSTC